MDTCVEIERIKSKGDILAFDVREVTVLFKSKAIDNPFFI